MPSAASHGVAGAPGAEPAESGARVRVRSTGPWTPWAQASPPAPGTLRHRTQAADRFAVPSRDWVPDNTAPGVSEFRLLLSGLRDRDSCHSPALARTPRFPGSVPSVLPDVRPTYAPRHSARGWDIACCS